MIRRAAPVLALAASMAVALAQYPPVSRDFLQGPPTGMPFSGDSIVFCVDPRDPSHEVDREIAGAVADALLVRPEFYTIERTLVTEDIEDVYIDLVNHCNVYLGFRLLSGTLPDWLSPTRPYYRTSYVLAVADPTWRDITDIPRDLPLGGLVGTAGDIRLLAYINTLPPDQRWARFPQGSHEQALQGVADGSLAGALVWAPALWQLARGSPAIARLHVVTARGVSEPIGVGAVLLSGNPFVLSQIDDAIAAVTEDRTIERIVTSFDFPATPATEP